MSSSCWPLESFDSLRSLRTRANGKGAMIAPPFALAHANREQVCTHADNRRLGLEQPGELDDVGPRDRVRPPDRKSTRLNSSHLGISYAVFCLKKKKNTSDTYNTRHSNVHD